MALATTTLSSAVGVNDTVIVVASAASMAPGRQIHIDDEFMQVIQTYTTGTTVGVLRGREGTTTAAHPTSANVTHGLASDFSLPPDAAYGSDTVPAQRMRVVKSYSASGAIALPLAGQDQVVILNGTGTLAMTVAVPTKDLDGCILYIVGNGKSTSSVTFASGLGNAGSAYDAITLQAAGQVGFPVMACNGFWVALNAPITGTSTALSVAVA